tara:strand:- start:148 stop:759 length:612 start_codon:yes stop_codon:yes gene_type:complete
VVALLLIAAFSDKYFPRKEELPRKIIHIGTGVIIPLAWWLEISAYTAILLASIITLGLLINYYIKVFPSMENINRKSFGTIAYGASITYLLIHFWPNNADAVCAGILTMALGDGFAGLIGSEIKSPNWIILKQKKSILGTICMFLMTCLVLTIISLCIQTTIGIMNIIIIASLATLLEQIGPWGIDNLTVPIGVSYSWYIIVN